MRYCLVLLSLVLFGLSACQAPIPAPGETIERAVDTSRYAGRWYIIANIPYFAERGKVASTFDISFPKDGKVIDLYTGRDGFDKSPDTFTMNGYIVPGTGNAVWRESPFWPLYFSYLIVYVSPDYQFALVGYPGKNYGWVLSRSPRMDDGTYRDLIGRFAAAGYDPTKFLRVPQAPDQVGQPGFQ
jgi:apolipoprotein D and lipocalin family protein